MINTLFTEYMVENRSTGHSIEHVGAARTENAKKKLDNTGTRTTQINEMIWY